MLKSGIDLLMRKLQEYKARKCEILTMKKLMQRYKKSRMNLAFCLSTTGPPYPTTVNVCLTEWSFV